MDALDRPYSSLDARLRPEDVTALVLEAQPSFTRRERTVLSDVAAHATSGMSDDY